MSGRPLDDAGLFDAIAGTRRSAYRLELQPAYADDPLWLASLTGEKDPAGIPGAQPWWELVEHLTGSGVTVRRVRVHEDPPNDYQRWERWLGRWNARAGEDIRYLTRPHAAGLGLPVHDLRDWWLIDDDHLVVFTWDEDGHLISKALIDEPGTDARHLWGLAWAHANRAEGLRVA